MIENDLTADQRDFLVAFLKATGEFQSLPYADVVIEDDLGWTSERIEGVANYFSQRPDLMEFGSHPLARLTIGGRQLARLILEERAKAKGQKLKAAAGWMGRVVTSVIISALSFVAGFLAKNALEKSGHSTPPATTPATRP